MKRKSIRFTVHDISAENMKLWMWGGQDPPPPESPDFSAEAMKGGGSTLIFTLLHPDGREETVRGILAT